jgi:ubiquinone/menaquinone biosynthesis C-methylase UbiE
MEPTDYSRIAARYDRNPIRHQIPADPLIEAQFALTGPDLTVLDLACGTGNYLVAQTAAFRGRPVRWLGLDLSAAMLDQARAKGLDADLRLGDAADLPWEAGTIDFVKVRFAHHHFADRTRVLAEVARVLRPGGRVSLFNIAPDRQEASWVHRFFPPTRRFDEAKFPTVTQLFEELEGAGLVPEVRVQTEVKRFPWGDLVREAHNRDMSQLTHLTEAEYAEGRDRLEAEAARGGSYLGDVALVEALGTKP